MMSANVHLHAFKIVTRSIFQKEGSSCLFVFLLLFFFFFFFFVFFISFFLLLLLVQFGRLTYNQYHMTYLVKCIRLAPQYYNRGS